MERKIVQKPNKFEVGQITFCNGGCTMQLPTFYKVVKRTEKTVWLIELESQLVEHDGYGQVGQIIRHEDLAIHNSRGIYMRDDHCDWGSSGMKDLVETLNDSN